MLFTPLFVLIAAGFQCSAYGWTLGTNVGIGAGLDGAVNFKLRLITGLKAAGIFEGYNGAISNNQLYDASRLLVQLLSTRFNLQLGNSYVASCYEALSVVNVSLGLDAYLDVLANFTSQILVQQNLLIDVDAALRTSCESIILACSTAFNLNIDISAALDIALIDVGLGLDASVGVVVSTDVGLEHGESVNGLDDDIAVKIAKKFGCILKTSDEFDLAVLSGDRKAVIQAIIPAIRGSLGVKAAIALAHCAGAGYR